jgi:hypothetical protein
MHCFAKPSPLCCGRSGLASYLRADEQPADAEQPTAPAAASVYSKVEDSLQPVIKDLPPPKQQEIVRTFDQQFMAVVRSGLNPQIDPETAKILASTLEKDNDNKFRFLTQKQTDSAAQEARSHEFAVTCHRDSISLLKPIIFATIALVTLAVAAGIYFIANGREAVGSSLLTGIFGLLFGYLGGLGTSRFITPKQPN